LRVFCGRAALLASLCVGFSWPVSCWANLVTNGGFETGSFGSTWGSFGDTQVCRISGCGSLGAFGSSAVDGTYAVVLADTTGTSSNEILTHFATSIGDFYTVSFDFGVESLSQNLTSQLLAPTGDTVLASSVFGPVASDPNGLTERRLDCTRTASGHAYPCRTYLAREADRAVDPLRPRRRRADT